MYLLVIGCKWESNFTWANSGYMISKKALKAFVEGPLQTCETGKEGSAEDLVLMGICLNTFISKLIYTADSSGAHHYHQSPVWGMFKQQGTSVTRKNAWFLSELSKHVIPLILVFLLLSLSASPSSCACNIPTFHNRYAH